MRPICAVMARRSLPSAEALLLPALLRALTLWESPSRLPLRSLRAARMLSSLVRSSVGTVTEISGLGVADGVGAGDGSAERVGRADVLSSPG